MSSIESLSEITIAPMIGRIAHADVDPGRLRSVSLPASESDETRVFLNGKQTLDLHPYYGPVVQDQPILAIDRVRYRGEPVAVFAIASESSSITQNPERFEIETGTLSPFETGSLSRSSRLVHVVDLLERSPHRSERLLLQTRTNRLAEIRVSGTATSLVAFRERRLEISKPLQEPGGSVSATAHWDGSRLTIETGTEDLDEVKREIAGITGLSASEIRIDRYERRAQAAIPGAIGVEAIAVALSREANSKVTVETRRMDFGWTGPRAVVSWDPSGNAVMLIDAGAVVGYLPLWLEDIGRVLAERTAVGADARIELVYSERPPIAASKSDWITALTEAMESSER